MTKTDSLEYRTIEWLRFALAVIVVIQHTYYLAPLEYGKDSLLPVLLSQGFCRLAVPAFFLISGYLFFANLENWKTDVWLKKLKRRVRSLLFPYLLWNVIAAAAQIVRLYILHIPFTFSDFFAERGWLRIFWDSNRYGIPDLTSSLGYPIHTGLPIDGPLWFIRDLMVLCLISPAIYFLMKKCGKAGLSVIALMMVLSIWIPFEGCSAQAFFFFALGAFLKIDGKGLIGTFRKIKWPSYAISSLLLAFMTVTFVKDVPSWRYACNLFLITGVPSIFNIASSLLESGIVTNHERLSNCSFFIYALHLATLLSFIGTVVCTLIPPKGWILFNLDYLLIPMVTVILCLALYQIMLKICPRLLSLLTGGRIA